MAVRATGIAVAVCAERAAGGGRHGLLPLPACAALVRRAAQQLRALARLQRMHEVRRHPTCP